MHKNPAKTLFLGKRLEYVPECHSTNDLAAKLGQEQRAIEGTVVLTDFQTAGRGQQGSSWEADPGKNLTFSIILKPSFLLVTEQYQLNKSIALGIYDALVSLVKTDFKIKWPNDVLAGEEKLCGILIENSLRNNSIQQSIVGIGLNVNQVSFNAPKASSLKLLSGQDFDLNALLALILSTIEARYLQLRAGQNDLIDAHYHERLFGLNRTMNFKSASKTFEGTIRGVDNHGRLTVESASGFKYYAVKEIAIV